MTSREVYPHAPAALVAVEARYPAAAALTAEQEQALKVLVADDFPLSQPLTGFEFTVGVSAGPQASSPRFTNRARTAAVRFGTQSVVVETTQHESFAVLRQLLGVVVAARQEVAPVDGLERLGLRYIDEIRVFDADPIDWSRWINPALLGPSALVGPLGMKMAEVQGVARFTLAGGRDLTLGYGPRQGHAVGDKPLRRFPMPPPSTFFLLDIDSSWTATHEIPRFDPASILELCGELHGPVSTLFEEVITDRLREEVLRRA